MYIDRPRRCLRTNFDSFITGCQCFYQIQGAGAVLGGNEEIMTTVQ